MHWPWPRSTSSKTNKTVLKADDFGIEMDFKSISLLEEVEINFFSPISVGNTERKAASKTGRICGKLSQSDASMARDFAEEKCLVFSFRQCFSARGCQAALP